MTHNKVTYILGAGASFPTIPVIANFPKSLRLLADDMLKIETTNRISLNELCRDLNWMADKAEEYLSVDAYAKFCFDNIKNEKYSKDFFKIKRTLSLFFMIRQFVEGKFEGRYRNFITRLYRDGRFPHNVKILNWNYDSQVQIASNLYRPEEYSVNDGVVTSSLITYYPSIGVNDYRYHLEDLNMVHLNGIAGYYFDGANNQVLHHNMDYAISTIDHIFERYVERSGVHSDVLTFAFEHRNVDQFQINKISVIEKMIADTDYLVIIGYSFPYPDNDRLDRVIFDTLNKGRLKTVFFQNPELDGRMVLNRFGIPDGLIINIKECRTFYIPDEIFQVKKSPPTAEEITFQN